MKFRSHTLDNGLQIIAECSDAAHSTAFGFFVRAGSRDENDQHAGVSHFLEHMAFKGTPRRSADDVNREFDEMGAHHNAFTSEEATVYYAAVLPECQESCVDLLADILRPSLRPDDFETEKQVIIEEIRMYDDQPPYGADDRLKELHFGRHALARSVLGSVESITKLDVEEMRAYFARRYAPGNIILAGAGRIDFDDLVRQTEARCGGWEPAAAQRDVQPPDSRAEFKSIRRANSTQQYILQMADGPAARDDARIAAKLVATVLGDDSGSRLYWDLVETGLAEHASIGHYEYDGAGVFMAYICCDPRAAAENLQRTLNICRDAERDGITPDELALAKNKLRSRLVLGSERPRNRLFSVGGNWLQRGEYRSVKDDIDDVQGATLDELHAVLARYPLSKSSTLAIGPLEHLEPPT